jgi:hypothetical protein
MRHLYEQTGKKIRHLDTLNALKQIRGDIRLDMKQLLLDIDNFKKVEPDTVIGLQRSCPLIVFLQTKEMLECYRIYSNAVLISCSRKRKNKYGLFHIFFTTVNNFGRVVVLGVALTNIKCKQGYEWMF